MARPFKSGVDYFPLDVVMSDEVELLESEHDLNGFAVLVKLYQRVYASNYWIKWDKKELIVFSKRVNVDKNEVIAIINTCLEWEIFDKELFDNHSILTSHGIQERFFEIVKRRTQLEIVEEFLLMIVPIRERQEIVIVDINSINEHKSTQSKVKESKVENLKKKELCDKAFEKWWNISPKRNGRRIGKKEAKAKFEKIDQNKWNDLKTATINYCDYLEKSGLSAMDPHRFLSGKWIEYIEAAEHSENKQDSDSHFLDGIDLNDIGQNSY